MKKFIISIFSVYKDSDYFLQKKVRALTYFVLTIFILVPIFLVFLNITGARKPFSFINILLSTIFLLSSFCLYLLRKGQYRIAANTLSIFTAVSLSVLVFQGKVKYKEGIILSSFQLIITVVFSSLFCSRLTTTIIFLMVLISGPLGIIRSGLLDREVAIVASANYIFAVSIIYAMSILLMSISTSTVDRLREEVKTRKYYEKLKDLFHAILDISSRLASSSELMSKNAEQFLQNMKGQGDSLQSIAAGSEELSAGFDNVFSNFQKQFQDIQDTHVLHGEMIKAMEETSLSVTRSIEFYKTLQEHAKQGSLSINEIEESILNISKTVGEMSGIVKMIADISKKTNLLALNASIEAARAGEEGRGFTIVSDEISRLAEESARSARKIGELTTGSKTEIERSIFKTRTGVELLSHIISEIVELNRLTQGITQTLKTQRETELKLGEKIRTVNSSSKEILEYVTEQKHASNEIAGSIYNANRFLQDNLQLAELLKAKIEEVHSFAENLKVGVEKFKEEHL